MDYVYEIVSRKDLTAVAYYYGGSHTNVGDIQCEFCGCIRPKVRKEARVLDIVLPEHDRIPVGAAVIGVHRGFCRPCGILVIESNLYRLIRQYLCPHVTGSVYTSKFTRSKDYVSIYPSGKYVVKQSGDIFDSFCSSCGEPVSRAETPKDSTRFINSRFVTAHHAWIGQDFLLVDDCARVQISDHLDIKCEKVFILKRN